MASHNSRRYSNEQIPRLFVAGGRAGKRASKSDIRHDFGGLSS